MDYDYIEIVLEDIEKNYLSKIIGESLRFEIEDIISSHFFDKKHNKDIEYQDINNFEDCFCDSGTGNLFLKKVEVGIELEKVMIIISSDEEVGDITMNFCENQFMSDMNPNLSESIERLVQRLLEIQKNYTINNIVVGYEPATDDDMKMFKIDQGHIKIYNEDIFQSSFAQLMYHTLREMS